MKILYREGFSQEITDIWDFIALDSPYRASNFVNEIKQKIESIAEYPLMHRKSIYFDDDNIRDLIHKGYVIVYKISRDQKNIIILGIKKYKNNIKETKV